MKTKIDSKNLIPFVGQTVSLYCQVGVVLQLTGTLVKNYGFCEYGLDIGNGNKIGFSYGQFEIGRDNMVYISVA